MKEWLLTTLLLCLYGFLKELRPSEPFITEYLIEPKWVNITLEEAYYDVYPVWTYSYLAVLVVVFLLTDFLRYKAVIVFEGFAYVATWCLLIFGKGVPLMQLMQFTYGIATSTEVAYYTYIYAKVPKENYQKVTSFTRVAILLGRFVSGISSQLLVSASSIGLPSLNYRQLNFISLGSVSLATIVSFFLPKVERTLYFHRNYPSKEHIVQPLSTAKDEDQYDNLEKILQNPSEAQAKSNSSTSLNGTRSKTYKKDLSSVIYHVKEDFCAAFLKNTYVLKWSIWWALATCGNFQVGNYIQPLWETIQPSTGENAENVHIWNGAVEAATTLTGAILSFAFGYIFLNWSLVGEPVLFLLSLLDGCILIMMALTKDIWVAYCGYWAYRALYQMMITVASFEVASRISSDSYGLVFGVNTFMALFFQTILTLVVADDAGLALPPRTQFLVYGGFWIAISLLFIALFVGTNFCRTKDIEDFRQKVRNEGFLLNNKYESSNPQITSNVNEEGRRDVPVGSIESQ